MRSFHSRRTTSPLTATMAVSQSLERREAATTTDQRRTKKEKGRPCAGPFFCTRVSAMANQGPKYIPPDPTLIELTPEALDYWARTLETMPKGSGRRCK